MKTSYTHHISLSSVDSNKICTKWSQSELICIQTKLPVQLISAAWFLNWLPGIMIDVNIEMSSWLRNWKLLFIFSLPDPLDTIKF